MVACDGVKGYRANADVSGSIAALARSNEGQGNNNSSKIEFWSTTYLVQHKREQRDEGAAEQDLARQGVVGLASGVGKESFAEMLVPGLCT